MSEKMLVAYEVSIADRIKAAQAQLKALKDERYGTLPRISAEELSVVVANEKLVSTTHEVAKLAAELRSERRFTEEDKDQVAAAKIAHRIEVNTEAVKAEAVRSVRDARLTGFKLTLRKDGRTAVRVSGVI
jgi:hypothetical protein